MELSNVRQLGYFLISFLKNASRQMRAPSNQQVLLRTRLRAYMYRSTPQVETPTFGADEEGRAMEGDIGRANSRMPCEEADGVRCQLSPAESPRGATNTSAGVT